MSSSPDSFLSSSSLCSFIVALSSSCGSCFSELVQASLQEFVAGKSQEETEGAANSGDDRVEVEKQVLFLDRHHQILVEKVDETRSVLADCGSVFPERHSGSICDVGSANMVHSPLLKDVLVL